MNKLQQSPSRSILKLSSHFSSLSCFPTHCLSKMATLDAAAHVLGTKERRQRFRSCRNGLGETGFLGFFILSNTIFRNMLTFANIRGNVFLRNSVQAQ